jgi:Flp pilus assembly protein TadB
VSKERARRRAAREAVLDREKSKRARAVSRRQRRRTLIRTLTPRRRRRTGRLFARRSRGQRLGIILLPLLAVAAVWYLVSDPALRLVLIAMIVLVLPAVVVVVLGRRT